MHVQVCHIVYPNLLCHFKEFTVCDKVHKMAHVNVTNVAVVQILRYYTKKEKVASL